eukprot:5431461-Prymnesium_polylepis.1
MPRWQGRQGRSGRDITREPAAARPYAARSTWRAYDCTCDGADGARSARDAELIGSKRLE